MYEYKSVGPTVDDVSKAYMVTNGVSELRYDEPDCILPKATLMTALCQSHRYRG